nr:Integrase (XerC) [uncultured Mediterranean phage uvMED]
MNPKERSPHKDTRGKKVRWKASYSIEVDGKVVRKQIGTFDTQAEAKAETKKTVNELIRINQNNLVSSQITVLQFIESQWKEHREKQLVNAHKIVTFIKMVKLTGLGDVALNKLTRSTMRRFFMEIEDYIVEKGYNRKSYMASLKANMNSMLLYAEQRAYIEEISIYNLKTNPRAGKVDREATAQEMWDKAKKIWTMDQITEFLPLFENLDKKPKNVDAIMWWAFFYIGIYTGLRRGEITALKFSDFDRETRTLTINQNAQLINYPSRDVIIKKPKSGSFGEVVYDEKLNEILDALELYHQVKGTLKNEYVLQYKWGGLIAPDYWSAQFKKIQLIAGIPEDQLLPSVHYMRHTHLSMLAYLGYREAEIQKRARHTDPRTTAKYYVHILDEKDKEMSDAFGQAIRDKQIEKGL